MTKRRSIAPPDNGPASNVYARVCSKPRPADFNPKSWALEGRTRPTGPGALQTLARPLDARPLSPVQPAADRRCAARKPGAALSVDKRDGVDATLTRAVGAGGRADPNPAQDLDFMFSRSVEDPDGYVWEIMWMDAAHAHTHDNA